MITSKFGQIRCKSESNHSELDRRPEIERATTLAKKALLYFGPFGLVAYLNGTTFIDRSRGAESRKILDDTIIKGRVIRIGFCDTVLVSQGSPSIRSMVQGSPLTVTPVTVTQ